MSAVAESGVAEICGLTDPDPAALAAAAAIAPAAAQADDLDALLALQPDGLVIATPSAAHAEQAIRALERGVAVFCQKPLARTAADTRQVVEAARASDRLLGIDFSYRYTEAFRRVHELVRRGALGTVYAVELVFHNAYGPDKPWFYDARLSGGGCLIDLGSHLVDFLHWAFDDPVVAVSSHLQANGRQLVLPPDGVAEDYAVGEIVLAGGIVARLACSWRLHTGCDARIEVAVYGTAGGASVRNVNGSFYDFVAEHCRGTRAEILAGPPDAWGGRAAVAWARRLASSSMYDPDVEIAIATATTLDRLYGRQNA